MHEFFDDDDQPCTADKAFTVVVTREAEWDHETRVRALRYQEHEDGLCKCGCNQPMDEAHNPEAVYLIDTYKCTAGRALEVEKRRRREEAEEQKLGDGWDDGLHFYARKPTERDFAAAKNKPQVKATTDAPKTKLERIRARGRTTGVN